MAAQGHVTSRLTGGFCVTCLLTVTAEALLMFGSLCGHREGPENQGPPSACSHSGWKSEHVPLRASAWRPSLGIQVFKYSDHQVSVQQIVSSAICEITFF